jgi:hypothetical protein
MVGSINTSLAKSTGGIPSLLEPTFFASKNGLVLGTTPERPLSALTFSYEESRLALEGEQ